jgi:hypothetical protein
LGLTLIAGLLAQNTFVLVSDLLLTADRRDQHDRDVPVPLAPIVADRGGTSVIAGLMQKVVIVAPGLSIAWSGDLNDGSRVVAELRQTFAGQVQLEEGRIGPLFEQLCRDYPCLWFVIAYASGGTLKFRWSSNIEPFKQDPIKWGFIAGSGRDHISRNIALWGDPGVAELWKAGPVAFAINYIGKAATDQLHDNEGHRDRWGGAFEIAWWDANGFHRLDNVLQITWTATEQPDGTYILQADPIFTFKYSVRDVSLIFVVSMQPEFSQLHIVNAPDQQLSDEEIDQLAQSVPRRWRLPSH